MFFKKIFVMAIIVSSLFAHLWARELKIKNEATLAVEVTVRAQGYESAGNFSTIVRVIEPGEETTIVIDEKNSNDTIFFVQGITIVKPPALSLISNECVLSNKIILPIQDECEPSKGEDRVVFTQREETALICTVIEEKILPFRLKKIK